MNIKLDAMMNKLNISNGKLLEAEDDSDKKLEKRKSKLQKKAQTKLVSKSKRKS